MAIEFKTNSKDEVHAVLERTSLAEKSDIEDALEEATMARRFTPEILLEKENPPYREAVVSLKNILEGYVAQKLRRVGIDPFEREIITTDTDALELYKKANPEIGVPQHFKGLGKGKIKILGDYLREIGWIE